MSVMNTDPARAAIPSQGEVICMKCTLLPCPQPMLEHAPSIRLPITHYPSTTQLQTQWVNQHSLVSFSDCKLNRAQGEDSQLK